jgi:transcriptional regulator with XRE-family HTH domain
MSLERQIAQRIALRVRKLRGAREAKALAERAGLSRSQWSRLEAGRNVPTAQTIVKAAAALRVKPSRLFGAVDGIELTAGS